jgi:hypothetical protein
MSKKEILILIANTVFTIVFCLLFLFVLSDRFILFMYMLGLFILPILLLITVSVVWVILKLSSLYTPKIFMICMAESTVLYILLFLWIYFE